MYNFNSVFVLALSTLAGTTMGRVLPRATSTTTPASPTSAVPTTSILALQQGFTNASSAFLISSNGTPTFLFDDSSYNALQMYISNSLKLPSSDAAFEALYNKPLFETEMTAVVAQYGDLYSMTEDALIAIYDHSASFQADTVAEIATLADALSAFASTASTSYTTMSQTLQAISGLDSGDPECRDGINTLTTTLQALLAELTPLATSCSVVEQQIVNFQGVIAEDNDAVSKVSTTFTSAAPSMNAVVTNLNNAITSLNTEITNDNNNAASYQYDIDNDAEDYAWIWPIGTVVWAAKRSKYESEINNAIDDRNSAMTTLAADNAQQAAVAAVMLITQDMQGQMTAIEANIVGAQIMMNTAASSLAQMLASINDMVTELDSAMSEVTGNPFWFSSASFVEDLTLGANDWSTIQTQAAAFATVADANAKAALP